MSHCEKRGSPRLLVAELLGDDFAQLQPQSVGHLLRQVVVRAPAKKHDVGHGANGTEHTSTVIKRKEGPDRGGSSSSTTPAVKGQIRVKGRASVADFAWRWHE